jgi:hypothetical protein
MQLRPIDRLREGPDSDRAPNITSPLLSFNDGAKLGHDSHNAVSRVVNMGHLRNSASGFRRRNTGISRRDEAQDGLCASLALFCDGGVRRHDISEFRIVEEDAHERRGHWLTASQHDDSEAQNS